MRAERSRGKGNLPGVIQPRGVKTGVGGVAGGERDASQGSRQVGPMAVETERTVFKSCLCALGRPALPLCAPVTSTLKKNPIK